VCDLAQRAVSAIRPSVKNGTFLSLLGANAFLANQRDSLKKLIKGIESIKRLYVTKFLVTDSMLRNL
jgi:hypothetical protein